ncbi:TIGR03619 family F420-dependent LLM class oxidoreductase [Actinomadura madurae]|uniref:TIGR03619 family F420-dependent LLM class oxidoreductase n=1 Tax=Actinomadura madurae TaxID=1993 RepID=UPI00399B92CA
MRIGVVQLIDGGPGRGLDFIRESAVAVEERGFASYWAPDHVLFFDEIESTYPYNESGKAIVNQKQGFLEPLLLLAAAATATTRVRLGTSVEVVPLRHPVERSKQVATLDILSGGRFDYGVGLGWMKEEFDACGIDFATRGRRTDEFLAACKALWESETSNFEGEFFHFQNALAYPKPAQSPHPPILVGGVSRPALRRAAKHDGWYGWNLTIDELDSALSTLDGELESQGRKRGDGYLIYLGMQIGRKTGPVDEYADQLRERGVDQFILGLPLSPTTLHSRLDDFVPLLGA